MDIFYHIDGKYLRPGSVMSFVTDTIQLLPELSHYVCTDIAIEEAYLLDLDQIVNAAGGDIIYGVTMPGCVSVTPGDADDIILSSDNRTLTVKNVPDIKQWQREIRYRYNPDKPVIGLLGRRTEKTEKHFKDALRSLKKSKLNLTVKATRELDNDPTISELDNLTVVELPMHPGIKQQLLSDITAAVNITGENHTRLLNEYATLKIPVIELCTPEHTSLFCEDLYSVLYELAGRKLRSEPAYEYILQHDLKYNLHNIREFVTNASINNDRNKSGNS